ncbi:MAG TPA: adenylyl cyclase [Alphaproteobacteria bacterium]|nr:adenylyl cyclase [Alphaproteobacteria bacterium]
MSELHTTGQSCRRMKLSPALGIAMLALTLPMFSSGCQHTPESYADALLGKRVLLFDDSMDMSAIQSRLDALHEQQKLSEFSDERYALLFKPGEYDLTVTVDYYMQAAGLGMTPGDVRINGAVQSVSSTSNNKVTTMFWRGAENLYVAPEADPMLWAVSQAAPYRRMHVAGNINFDKGSWASGGVLANSIVEGRAGLTTGQQWFTRNSEIGRWEGGNWNRVFVGVKGAPADQWPDQPTTIVEQTPVIREKPFLTWNEVNGYSVFVPALRHNSRGVSWSEGPEAGEQLPLEQFHVAHPERDDAESINRALAEGKHLLLTPGIYPLDNAIEVSRGNTVILGLGLPSLVPQTGKPAMTTSDAGGLKIAGIMIDAGPERSSSLLRVGIQGAAADHSANPTSLHDVYCRVGGPHAGRTEACLVINSNDVIGDHLWLWRADHGDGVAWEVNPARHGLVVNGDDVTMYGLFNEHFQDYQTLWSGERGRTYFYQSEIPYDPPGVEQWNDNGQPGFASYKVADSVQSHQAWGLGIYSFFQGEAAASGVRLENAMEVPEKPGIEITHIVNFAELSGGINHVINGLGPATNVGELTLFDGFPGREPD